MPDLFRLLTSGSSHSLLVAPGTVSGVMSGVVSGVVSGADDAGGPAYDLVLLAHVLTAMVGLGALLVAGSSASSLRRTLASGRHPKESLRRYYKPGINWGGRILVLVPFLGIALVAMSRHAWSFSDPWILVGLCGWVLVMGLAESLLWPAERQLQALVTEMATGAGAPSVAGPSLDALCRRVEALVGACSLALVVIAVIMVAKP